MTAVTTHARRTLRSDEHWNHNTHYHRLLLRAAPPPWGSVLDVGCGEGLLTRRVAPFAGRVVGIDPDDGALEDARRSAPANATYVPGDVLSTALDGPFDLVTCVAVLHHMDLRVGLERLRDLTAPGGKLVVVGLARPASPVDLVAGGGGAGSRAREGNKYESESGYGEQSLVDVVSIIKI